MRDGLKNFRVDRHRTHAVGGRRHGRLRTTAYAWMHGPTQNWNRRRSIRQAHRAQASNWLTHPHRFEGFAYARDCARASRFVGCAGRTERFGQDRQAILDSLVDWWSASSVRVARWSVDGSAVSELPEDLRFGSLAWRRCDDSLVHKSERSDCDSSSGETDRADGCAMHGVVVSSRLYSERSCQIRFGGDKGGK